LVATIATQVSLHIETLRLTEELQKRAKELEKLDRLKSSFLANMSHELRTPLNSILGFADVILEGIDGPLTDYMENDLKLIQKNGQHLLHLINDVLDMAKIESGKMNLNLEKFFLNEIFVDVFNITSSLAGEKMLSVSVETDSETEIELLADRIRLRQVMINLVNNAIKFTEKGGKISVNAHRKGNHVLIRVHDTGLGIPSTHLESIFQEFTQVDTSTTRKVGGTGLGLPISRKLIEMHGGRIWAESTGVSGEGSTLIVDLPIEANVIEPVS
jgi:signal transduction histidine kinase